MEPGITWYDVLDVLPGADPAKIRREYEAKTNLLRPELISGAPSNVLQAISRAQGMLDHAWEVLGDPASRGRGPGWRAARRACGAVIQPERRHDRPCVLNGRLAEVNADHPPGRAHHLRQDGQPADGAAPAVDHRPPRAHAHPAQRPPRVFREGLREAQQPPRSSSLPSRT